MNIFYIGPYKYNNSFGICSRDIINSLANQNINLSTRNIFLNNPYENTTMINYSGTENEPLLNKYDFVIQHCPIEMMYVDRSISDKHIAIPIMDYGIDESSHGILKQFDIVCVDDLNHQKNLTKINTDSVLLNYKIQKNTDNKNYLNLGIHNFKSKMYFIGSYEQNANIIQKLVVSFILAFRDNPDISLILILDDINKDAVAPKVEKTIYDIYKKLNYNSAISPIQTIMQPAPLDTLHLMHKELDIFINIQDEYDTGLNYYLAKLYNNHIIDINDTESVFVPYLDGYAYSNRYKYSVLTSSLINALKQKLADLKNKKQPQYTNTKTIEEIIGC